MSVYKRVSPSGGVSYQVKVRVKGYPPVTATFKKKTDANHWAQRTEADIRDDKYFPNTKAKKHTVSDLIDIYLAHLKGKNRRRHDEVKYLLDWWKAELGQTVLAHFKSETIVQRQQKLLNE